MLYIAPIGLAWPYLIQWVSFEINSNLHEVWQEFLFWAAHVRIKSMSMKSPMQDIILFEETKKFQ
jgi:hypothetical protein